MKEIGGYIELDSYRGEMLYADGIKLNCGRNALDYIIKAKRIKKILMPKFMCSSCDSVLNSNQIQVRYYSIGLDFKPILRDREADEWLYLVNYYGQLMDGDILSFGEKIICDNAQAYFHKPIHGIDTIYTCRKFFGVPDGAILYSDTLISDIPIDESYERMHFLLGRYERGASEFYQEYVQNNDYFETQPIKQMSKLTDNLLHAIDYQYAKKCRTENFTTLHTMLADINLLSIRVPEGAFMYPLYIKNGAEIREKLKEIHIYIPVLWPDVFDRCAEDEVEYDMAKNILPLPVDQRYVAEDMRYMAEYILNLYQD